MTQQNRNSYGHDMAEHLGMIINPVQRRHLVGVCACGWETPPRGLLPTCGRGSRAALTHAATSAAGGPVSAPRSPMVSAEEPMRATVRPVGVVRADRGP